MKICHTHTWTVVVGIVLRPDGSRSDGRYWCQGCGSILDFQNLRWKLAGRFIWPTDEAGA